MAVKDIIENQLVEDVEFWHSILARFEISDNCKFRVVHSSKNSWVLQSENSQLVIKIYRSKSYNSVLSEVKLLEHLREFDIPVPYVYCNRFGEAVFRHNELPAILMKSDFVDLKSDGIITNRRLYNLGRVLAYIHDVPTTNSIRRLGLIQVLLQNRIKLRKSTELKSWTNDKFKHLKLKISRKNKVSLVHGNITRDNILFDTQERVGLMLDWKNVGLYYQFYDLGYTILHYCFEDTELKSELVNEVLRGYESITKLSKADIVQIGYFISMAAAIQLLVTQDDLNSEEARRLKSISDHFDVIYDYNSLIRMYNS